LSVGFEIHSPSHRRHDERGAALVEFAIASTILLVLLFGIIEYGYVLSFKQSLTQAAAEGARQAAVGGDHVAAVTKAVGAFNQTCSDTGPLTCTYLKTAAATGCTSNDICMQVKVSYDWKNHPLLPQFPGLGLLLPDTLTSTSITRLS
jgi:Flp pilus assembly protein TadG